ncbi:regulator of nonsense transcripts-related protein [Theileria orientalis]|uniref:Regulator of nonsense transcripts-related protein n=1 Tax=Theileria orientalis TaxID=68886 RepID=A0A976MBB0_THEOR|nr:regulator of nonsense transcripts-related protein [Theileria orientalis]
MIYNDDNVLNCLTIKQRIMGFTVDWDIQTIGTLAHCKYNLKLKSGKELSGETTGLNKKVAKKEAARRILSELPTPTFEEMEENSKWIISGHKSVINVSDDVIDRSFTARGHSCTIEWKVGDTVFVGSGEGKTIKEAELYANQDLYVNTHDLKKNPPDTIEPISKKRKFSDVVFEEELSKSDASQMNTLRNSVSSKMKVNQQEKVTACPGGFQCTLTWIWKDQEGNINKKVVCKQGSSKSFARANASKAMLVEVGTIQDVTSEESKTANQIRTTINHNLKKGVELSCELIERSNCTVWRLFIIQLWSKLIKKRDYVLTQNVINTIVSVQEKGVNYLPTDIWETLLNGIIFVMDDEFARSAFQYLRSIKLDKNNFYSEKAKDYYHNNSILLCMESQSCIFNEILLRKEMERLYHNQMLVMSVSRIQLPLLTLKTQITQEYLKNNTTKEDDVVMLLPLNRYNQITQKSWDMGILCSVTKHKTESLNLSLGLKYLADLNINKSDTGQSINNEHLLLSKSSGDYEKNVIYEKGREEVESEDVFSCTVFGVFHIQSMVTHIRMMEALQALTHTAYPINSNASKYDYTYEMKEILIHSKNMNTTTPMNKMLPTTMSLTPSQHMACSSAITNPVTLIQGPPGTGKTHVACAIIDCWNRMYPNVRILAVADSNVAADNLIEGLSRRSITALRIGASSEWDMQEEAIKGLYRYNNYLQMRMAGMHKEANSLRVLLFTEAIKKHKIVIATCVGSGNEILASHTFPFVIIDECAQSIEASNLIPIGRGCRSLVLIGDHKQLRPTIISIQASVLGLSKSLLERLIEDNVAPVHLLDVQRRMHPSIAEFPNLHFYEGQIRNQDVNDINRPQILGFKWPMNGNNLVFVDVSTGSPNTQFETSHGTSKFNTMELTCVLALVNSFLKAGDVKENQIGILTPYDAQRGMIRKNVNLMKDYKTHLIEIDSVDGFQGKEKDLIIFSAVRSNLSKDIGFLKDPRRMNVMLTRAKRGMIILGDIYTLMNDAVNWRPFINWIYSKQLNVHVSQLNNYMLYPDENLPKSHNDIKKLDDRLLKSDSTGKRKNPFEIKNNVAE